MEGKCEQAKRRFSLDRVMAKLDNTSKTALAIAFFVMNIVAGLRKLLWLFLCQFLSITISDTVRLSKIIFWDSKDNNHLTYLFA